MKRSRIRSLDADLRAKVLDFAEGRCVYCGRREFLLGVVERATEIGRRCGATSPDRVTVVVRPLGPEAEP